MRSVCVLAAWVFAVGVSQTPEPSAVTPAPSAVTPAPTDDTDMPSPMPSAMTPAPTDDTDMPSPMPTSVTMDPTTSEPTSVSDMPSPMPSPMPSAMTPAPSMMTDSPTAMPTAATPAPTGAPTLTCKYDASEDEPYRNTDSGIAYAIAFYGNIEPYDPYDPDDPDTSAILWPYRLGVCTATGPFDGLYGKFECNDDGNMVFYKYGDNDNTCSEDPTETTTYTSDSEQESDSVLYRPATVWRYECSGATDTGYVAVRFAAESTCGTNADTFGVVNVCGGSRMPDQFQDEATSYLYCDASGAKSEAFSISGSNLCQDADYCSDLTIENECAKVFQTSATIYGQVNDCQSVEKANTRDDDDSATHVSLFFTFTLALFSLFVF